MPTPTVFISYSHDSPEHKAWVLKLATDLRSTGIDASLDQWDLVPGQDVVSFMHDGVAKADRVLLVCTEQYVRKSERGLGGVGYERLIVTAEMVEAIETKKFIPIVRANPSTSKTPKHLGPRLFIDFSDDATYAASLEALCRELLGMPATPKPPLGSNRFSALVPTDAVPARTVLGTGALPTGVPLLSGKWFESERATAEAGLATLGVKAGMELRFALHTPVNKSQIDLLTAVRASEVHTFGWPIGITLDNRSEYKPRPFGDGIRAEVAIQKDGLTGRESFDYWALAKSGDFYLLQNLFEDQRDEGKIFFNTRIVRVTEALMFASGLYTHLGAPPDARLSVRVTHFGLAGRILSSAGGRRYVSPRTSVDDRCESEVVVTLGEISETLVTDVQRLTAPLFMLFEFAEFADKVYEDIVRKFENGESS
ncbi:MAG: toll/interleukin-1 receptor domain-containing protein [Dehalococcoidia bacterium]